MTLEVTSRFSEAWGGHMQPPQTSEDLLVSEGFGLLEVSGRLSETHGSCTQPSHTSGTTRRYIQEVLEALLRGTQHHVESNPWVPNLQIRRANCILIL